MTDAVEPPKRKAFKRQRALEGVLRTYKVRMLVTDAQRQELKLAFSMARRAYNWAVGCVNAGAKTNFGELRKIFFSEPSSIVSESTCKSVAASPLFENK